MAAVELGGYVHGQVAVAQRAMRGLGIGRGGGEIAAHREEHLAAPVQHRFDRTNGVEAVLARRLEAEYLLQPVQECRRWPLEDAHRAIALHVAVARSEEHTSELQSLMRISYALFC